MLHLGDQLDSVNGPRSRVVDAQRLMTHLNEFISDEPMHSSLFSDPNKVNLPDCADIGCKHLFVVD